MNRRAVVLLSALGLVSTTGCDLDPYCLDCVDGGEMDGGTDAAIDAAREDAPFVRVDSGPEDAGPELPDGCAPGAVERCNDFDDDCDLMIDEGIDITADPANCGGCGMRCAPEHALGVCSEGTCSFTECDVGYYDLNGVADDGCEYRCVATDPDDVRCDLRDNDCDGDIDEDVSFATDPANCGSCGSTCRFAHAMGACDAATCALGACDEGFWDADGNPANGCEYACVASVPAVETCNLRDDDCDGTIDEGDPGGGATCGTATGACETGIEHCVGGALTCTGGVSPTTEVCNGLDDDCDGTTDDGNPGGGGSCGTDVGACTPGTRVCSGGTVVCMGAVGPAAEVCDGIDNNCDSNVDEGNPGGGASCGTDVGECTAGVLTCGGGSFSCVGQTTGGPEVCDGLDNDCDGMVDDGFAFSNDPNNCGACGNVCSFPFALESCSSGTCGILACETGHYNLDGMPGNGCEYACDFAGAEACNGRDDDCDGLTDEMLTAPSMFCNPNGVCAGTTATCSGSGGWVCSYPSTYQASETRCDNLDNDCDGSVDEPYPLRGTSCDNGALGVCRQTGTYVCNAAGTGVVCNAPPPGSGSAEVCDNLDNDCDGTIDDNAPATWVQFTVSGSNRWIFAYEASRPDATGSSAGLRDHRVCSEPGRLPWTNITHDEAQAECQAIGATLCTEAEWQAACQSSSGSCLWSYSGTCTTYSATTCNGNDYDGAPGTGGNQDVVLATGSLPMCYASWGTAARRVFDMSGNIEEWTAERSAGVNPIRGGSMNDTAGGLQCGFDFVVAGETFRAPTVGFRCCRATAP